jgi:hypothetical protein
VAYAFLEALTLTQEQLNDLQDTIREVSDPLVGARIWGQDNRATSYSSGSTPPSRLESL